MEKIKANWSNKLWLPLAVLGIVCGLVYVFVPEGASEEYKYTAKVISWFCFPLLGLAFICNRLMQSIFVLLKKARYGWLFCVALGLALWCVPFFGKSSQEMFWIWGLILSFLWLCGAFMLALGLFLLAARLDNWASSLVCLFASLFLAFFIGEGYFLFSAQTQDGKYFDGKGSHYVKEGQAAPDVSVRWTKDGVFPARPDHPSGSFAHREFKYNQLLYDVRCTLDDLGRRITPESVARPQADILIFGCSFTFGHGLENDQTWPWKLGKLLGPEWHVVNYAYNAFGAQQMLNYLESGHVEMPTAPFRQAFFLGINHHLHRFTGLFFRESSWYGKENGQVVRKGLTTQSPYHFITSIRNNFNGSQLAENAYYRLAGYFLEKKSKEFSEIYIWIIKQAANLLKEKYNTPLTVLLWPDLEWLAPDMEAAGLDIIYLRQFLGNWDEKGDLFYQIVPHIETHPNDIATTEIAEGIARWLATRPGAPAEAAFTHAANSESRP